MNHLKKIVAALLCSVVIAAPMGVMNAEAATFSQVNADTVFINQQKSYSCTLAANVMMLRRAAILLGDPNWMSITESKCASNPSMWTDNGGMVWDYVFYGTTQKVTVSNPRVDQLTNDTSNSGRKKLFIEILKNHPEGVVIYNYSIPHAILLTDYDAKTDTFYCSDPNIGTPTKRVPMSESNVNIYNVTSIWWIVSPELHFTSNSTSTSSSQMQTVSDLNETWKVTDIAGLNLRADHGTQYEKIGYVPYMAVVKVTKRKVSGGYNWGYVNYDSKNGWIALDYATKIEDSKAEVKEKPQSEIPAKAEEVHSAFDNVSSVSAEEIVLGEKITFRGAAQNGTAPYTYAYYYKRSYSNTWTTVKNFSESRSETVEPLTSATYDVCVKIKDAKGNLEKKYMTFRVRKPLTNKSAAVNSAVYLGDDINLKGKASGGIGVYEYAYYYKRSEDENWVTLKDFSEDTTAGFKPLKATTYDICIKVKDEKGHVEKVYKEVKVRPKLVNDSRVSSDSVKVGESIRMTAAAAGGEGGYQYAFYYKRAENTDWVTAKGFGESTEAEFRPLAATTYEICVKVRDFYGRVEKKYFKVNVTK